MKFKKSVSILVLGITVLVFIATICGIFTNKGPGERDFTTVFGEVVILFGKGVYQNNTVNAVMQAKPQDIVTLVIGIPLLVTSLFLTRKGCLKGKILLTGVLGYLLITYMMYTFIAMYNRLFLVYVVLMGASFFAFLLMLLDFDLQQVSSVFDNKLPRKFIGGYLMFSAVIVGLLWLRRTFPTLIDGSVPLEVELGTTLPVQAFDLAFFLPGTFVSGLLLIKKNQFGYLLAPVSTIGNGLIMIALLTKGISMQMADIPDTMPLIIMTSLFSVLAITSTVLTFKSVKTIE